MPPTIPIKDEFLLDPEITFLNHGSFGATPRVVFEKYQDWQRELEKQPVEFLARRAPNLLCASREILAEYLGTHRDNLVYVTNTTVGINIIARSLKLIAGDTVISSDHEYGAMDRTWRFLAQKNGFSYHPINIPLPLTSPEALLESFWNRIPQSTRVIFISHITSPTSLIFPVKQICRRARENNILTIIDGAHAPGQINLALEEIGSDFYVGNLHKWLCAPKGSAFLYARPDVQHLIDPLIVSWGWQAEVPGSSRFIDYLEYIGTRDIAAFLSIPEAIKFQQVHQWPIIRQECHSLAARTRQMIQSITGIPPLSPDSPMWYAQMAAMPLPKGLDTEAFQRQLYEHFRIEIPVTNCQNQSFLRFSFQAYNSEKDVQTLIAALQDLL